MNKHVTIRTEPGGRYSIGVFTDRATVGDLKRALQRLPEDARITDYDGDGELLMIEAIPAELLVKGGAEKP